MDLNSGFLTLTTQEPDRWEPETEGEAGLGQDEEVEEDQIAPADGQEVEIKAQCCYKIIPGFFSHGTPWTQGGC